MRTWLVEGKSDTGPGLPANCRQYTLTHHMMTLHTTIPTVLFAAVVLMAAVDGPRESTLSATSVGSLVAAVTAKDSVPLYSEEQATAGATIFSKICAECHEKKDITGENFRAKWTGRPLFDLYELVRSTMPDSNPGSLSREDYANALAYILKLNGVPAGPSAVMPDSTSMKGAKLDLPPPGH